MTIPAINFGRALQPGSPVHLAPRPSIQLCFLMLKNQGRGISVDCCGVTWSCQKIPKQIQGLEASSGIAGKLFDVGNPRVCHRMALGSCVRCLKLFAERSHFFMSQGRNYKPKTSWDRLPRDQLLLPHTRTGFKDCDQGLTSVWAQRWK